MGDHLAVASLTSRAAFRGSTTGGRSAGFFTSCAPARRGATFRNAAGPHATVCNRWARQGVRERLFGTLAARSPGYLHLLDSAVVCAHQHAAGGKKGVRITPSDAREAG